MKSKQQRIQFTLRFNVMAFALSQYWGPRCNQCNGYRDLVSFRLTGGGKYISSSIQAPIYAARLSKYFSLQEFT